MTHCLPHAPGFGAYCTYIISPILSYELNCSMLGVYLAGGWVIHTILFAAWPVGACVLSIGAGLHVLAKKNLKIL